jgi:hypothetical protein
MLELDSYEFAVFNYSEAGVWIVFSVIFGVSALATRRFKRLFLVFCITFLLFGVSDIIEVQTGAWWRPFWLLLLKASCVISLVVCWIRYFRLRGRSGDSV